MNATEAKLLTDRNPRESIIADRMRREMMIVHEKIHRAASEGLRSIGVEVSNWSGEEARYAEKQLRAEGFKANCLVWAASKTVDPVWGIKEEPRSRRWLDVSW